MSRPCVLRFSLKELLKRSLTFGTILSGADATLQSLERWKKGKDQESLDWKSLKRHGAVGGFCLGPVLYFYYSALDWRFPGQTGKIVAIKVACDVVFANILYYSLFYYCLSYLEHRDHVRANNDVAKAFGVSYLSGMIYWIPMMAFNFRFLSPSSRVFFVAMASYIEMNGLCLIRRWKGSTP